MNVTIDKIIMIIKTEKFEENPRKNIIYDKNKYIEFNEMMKIDGFQNLF